LPTTCPDDEEKKIKVFAPATVANVSCGFDVLGFALHEPGDEIILEENSSGELKDPGHYRR
jgi:homoserine kinase